MKKELRVITLFILSCTWGLSVERGTVSAAPAARWPEAIEDQNHVDKEAGMLDALIDGVHLSENGWIPGNGLQIRLLRRSVRSANPDPNPEPKLAAHKKRKITTAKRFGFRG